MTSFRLTMNHRAAATVAVFAASVALGGCTASTHNVQPSRLGTPSRSAALLAVIDAPGPVEVETVASTKWAVDRSGLVNLDAPKAKAAHLQDGDEPIEVYFHVVRHPGAGTYIIDTGVERALRDRPSDAVESALVKWAMHTDKMSLDKPLGDWLAEHRGEPLRGVFFTHLHLDHVSGAPDLPKTTPLFAGPGETTTSAFLNVFTQGTIDAALDGLPPVSEWRYAPDPDGRFAGVVDVFGDGAFWAVWTPGHTPGSTAYIARTPRGPVLFTGDTCHTRWGWDNEVEPGSYTSDHAANRESLARLRRLVQEHPSIDVRLGHQHAVPKGAIANAR